MIDVWPIRTNWRSAYEVSYAFQTEILESTSGRETRRAWRDTPRKQLTFLTSAITFQRFRALKAFLEKNQGPQIVAPEVTRGYRTTAASDSGSHAFALAEIPEWAIGVQYAVLIWEDRIEYRTINAVFGSVISFVEANTDPWPRHTLVCPGLVARVPDSMQASHIVAGIAEGTVSLDIEPGLEVPDYNPTPAVVWNGREVFLQRCNWAAPQSLSFEHSREVVDYSYGRLAVFQPIAFGRQVRTADYLGVSRAEAYELMSFFHRAKGRQGEFYVPTDEPDIPLAATWNSGSTTFTAEGTLLARAFGGSKVYKAISVKMKDGRRFYRKINSLAVSGQNSVFSLTQGAPYAVEPAQVEVISWLPLCRNATDELSMSWITDRHVKARFTYQALEDRPAE